MIVEKNVVMNQGSDCVLIHYMCVDPDLLRQGIGSAMLKNVIDEPEYEHKIIMVVTALPKDYENIVAYNSIGDFFYNFFSVIRYLSRSMLLICWCHCVHGF